MFNASVAVTSLELEVMPSFVDKLNQFIGVEGGQRVDGEKLQYTF